MLVIVIKTVLFPLTEQIFSVPQNLPGCMTIPLPAVRLLIARKRTLKGSEVPPLLPSQSPLADAFEVVVVHRPGFSLQSSSCYIREGVTVDALPP